MKSLHCCNVLHVSNVLIIALFLFNCIFKQRFYLTRFALLFFTAYFIVVLSKKSRVSWTTLIFNLHLIALLSSVATSYQVTLSQTILVLKSHPIPSLHTHAIYSSFSSLTPYLNYFLTPFSSFLPFFLHFFFFICLFLFSGLGKCSLFDIFDPRDHPIHSHRILGDIYHTGSRPNSYGQLGISSTVSLFMCLFVDCNY